MMKVIKNMLLFESHAFEGYLISRMTVEGVNTWTVKISHSIIPRFCAHTWCSENQQFLWRMKSLDWACTGKINNISLLLRRCCWCYITESFSFKANKEPWKITFGVLAFVYFGRDQFQSAEQTSWLHQNIKAIILEILVKVSNWICLPKKILARFLHKDARPIPLVWWAV